MKRAASSGMLKGSKGPSPGFLEAARARICVYVILILLALSLGLPGGNACAFDLLNPNSWPFIPVPEAATDPFGGTTVGLMPVLLKTTKNQQITSIIAPDVNYNTILGAGANLRYLAYPSANTQWFAIGGGNENNAGSLELDWATGLQRRKWWSLEGHFYFQQNPTERFFGLGNNSNHNKQSIYALQQLYLDMIFGVNITPYLQVALRERPRFVRLY
ncbi:MAG: hypothetical protein ACRD19_02845, partial [Terriglobia bacterium]